MGKQLNLLFLIFIQLVTLLSCKSDLEGPGVDKSVPTNLVVEAVVSKDGTGNVNFKATANNAISYDFEFGDGVIQTGTNGIITYQYTLEGTHTFNVNVTAKSSSNATLKKSIEVEVTVQKQESGLVWSDEFTIDGAPDPQKWIYDIGAGGWGNQEVQYYTNRSSNVKVQDGVLKITANKETIENSSYSSARIKSQTKFDFKYGKVEVRAKLPTGGGIWPAIWMLGSNITSIGWPDCGEIDIMEFKGNEPNKIYGTLHYPGRFGGNADGNSIIVDNLSTDFHIYTLEWDASIIKISVDDKTVHTVANNASIPFNHNFFFIMNVAMGGTFGGNIDSNFSTGTMEVDYIRVYQ